MKVLSELGVKLESSWSSWRNFFDLDRFSEKVVDNALSDEKNTDRLLSNRWVAANQRR